MGEIMKDPSKATDEDIKALNEIHELFNTFKDKIKPFEGISLNSGRTIKEIAKRFYQENLILSAILEAYVYKEKYCFSDLNKWVFNYVDNDFIWDVSIPYYNMCMAKLCNNGLLKAEFQDTSDSNPSITITDKGRDALRQQTFANLAQSSLFNYQASLSNEQSVKLNRQIKCITVVSAFVAFAALVVAVIALFKDNCF